MADREWHLPPAPDRLWDNDTRAAHRRKRTGFWQSREPSVAEEQYAVEEALRAAHVAIWSELWQRVHTAEARVVELEAEVRKLRMNPN